MASITSARVEELTIGELSELTAVNIETIRYYERIKVLPTPPRTSGGRRVYDPNHLRVLAFIRRSRELGFSLDEIRALIRLGGPAKVSCRQVRASQHLNNIRAKIADLRKLERLLAKTVARCTGTNRTGLSRFGHSRYPTLQVDQRVQQWVVLAAHNVRMVSIAS